MYTNIDAERVRLQLTKQEAAVSLGITPKTYLSYVRGDTPIPSDVLLRMAKMFRCTTDYLLTDDNANTSAK